MPLADGSSQHGSNYYWFHFKTTGQHANCVNSNYETSISPSRGFYANDGGSFWPTKGWNSGIQVWVRTQ